MDDACVGTADGRVMRYEREKEKGRKKNGDAPIHRGVE